MQCNAMQCNAMQCNAMQCNAMQCNAMQCNAMQCNAMQCNAMQCNAMQCNAMQCNALQYNTIQYNTIQYNTIQYNCNQYDYLRSEDLQFPYKTKISVIHCVNSVNEIVNYYINNLGKVYVCTLDASKAFDWVNLLTLFKKLFERNMCPLFLRFFYS